METRNILLLLLFSLMLLTAAENSQQQRKINGVTDTVFPNVNSIVFGLYTRENRNGERIVLNDVNSVKRSHWNASKPTAIMIHGWFGNGTGSIITICDAYLNATDEFNIILVHWGTISENPNYFQLSTQIKKVAKHIAAFINFMRENAGLTNSKLRLIGHSFGAHIAGFTAGNIKQYGLVAEILALDPAGPTFHAASPNDRVDKSQAKNVQAIHTNPGAFGIIGTVGTSDFFANYGPIQPGCGADVIGVCSHYRSCDYYIESIKNPKAFLATSDEGRAPAYMGGINLDPNAKGTYRFKTNSKPPYAIRKEN